MDSLSLALSFIAIIYWLYLLDPLKLKPPFRLYKALLNDKKTLTIHICISLVLAVIAIMRIVNAGQDLFSFIPILFISLIFVINGISNKINFRDFQLILRGEKTHNNWFDILASIIVMVLPFMINFGIFVALKH